MVYKIEFNVPFKGENIGYITNRVGRHTITNPLRGSVTASTCHAKRYRSKTLTMRQIPKTDFSHGKPLSCRHLSPFSVPYYI